MLSEGMFALRRKVAVSIIENHKRELSKKNFNFFFSCSIKVKGQKKVIFACDEPDLAAFTNLSVSEQQQLHTSHNLSIDCKTLFSLSSNKHLSHHFFFFTSMYNFIDCLSCEKKGKKQ